MQGKIALIALPSAEKIGQRVNRILSDLVKACKPRWMEVCGEFRPRGGISLTITATEGVRP